ncbi:class II aldolase/adducin family protein [Robinsoniella peoriensis]
MYSEEKEALAGICHMLYQRNLVTACDGNISSKVSKDHILLTPSGMNKGLLLPEDIIVLDLAGNTVEGNRRASKEYPMHQLIYQMRPDVKAVVHTHPVFATAFALAGKNIPDNYLIETTMMLPDIALAEYAPPGTQALAEAIRPHVPVSNAILLKNHGALTYGKDLTDAYNKMEVLESIAKTIIMSKVLGEPQVIPG